MVSFGEWGLSRPAKKSKILKIVVDGVTFWVCKGLVVVRRRACTVIFRLKLRISDLDKELL